MTPDPLAARAANADPATSHEAADRMTRGGLAAFAPKCKQLWASTWPRKFPKT